MTDRPCTCVGTCRGKQGLGEGWVCVLDSDPDELTVTLTEAACARVGQAALRDPDEPVIVFKLEPKGLGNPMIFNMEKPNAWRDLFQEVTCHLHEMENGGAIEITKDVMPAGDLAMLPDHTGW